ncbi:MAG: SDR family oxidoreductase [Chlamydiia bacterium]|nr:SDR family oxidoreductase [Chlamydiia bacterium]
MKEDIIIIGSSGFIGHHLTKTFQPQLHTNHRNSPYLLDLNKPKLNTLPIKRQTHVIITAGCTNINDCTNRPRETYTTNVKGTLDLVRQCKELGLFPILFSSDYVFDGKSGNYTEESPTHPINEYGRQKEMLEQRIQEIAGDNYLMLRLSKIYSTSVGDLSLLDEMIEALRSGKIVRAATDQVFCPLHIKDLKAIIQQLIEKRITGLVNVAGKEKISRYEIAIMVCQALGASPKLIQPISLDELGAPRPKNTSLCCERLYQTVSIQPQTLKTSIEELSLQSQSLKEHIKK